MVWNRFAKELTLFLSLKCFEVEINQYTTFTFPAIRYTEEKFCLHIQYFYIALLLIIW